eukprot:3111829-Karenia_brevis.AAC.1
MAGLDIPTAFDHEPVLVAQSCWKTIEPLEDFHVVISYTPCIAQDSGCSESDHREYWMNPCNPQCL